MKKEKTVPRKCKNCEFNFGNVCAGHGKRTDNGEDTYGMPIDLAKSMFPNGCEDFGLSLYAFTKQEKMNGR